MYNNNSGGTTTFSLRTAAATFFSEDIPTADEIKETDGSELSLISNKRKANSGQKIAKKYVRPTKQPRPSVSG